jgi:hypothetical protein
MEEKVSPSRVALLGSEECEACKCADVCLCPVIPSFREDEGRDRDSGCRGRMRWWEHLQSEMTRDAERERLITARVEQARADRADFLATASVMLLPAGNRETAEQRGGDRDKARVMMNRMMRISYVTQGIMNILRQVVQRLRIGWTAERRNWKKSRIRAEMCATELSRRAVRGRVMRLIRACSRARARSVMSECRDRWRDQCHSELRERECAERCSTIRARDEMRSADTRMVEGWEVLVAVREVQVEKSRVEGTVLCWEQALRERKEKNSEGLIRAVEVGASAMLARVWWRLVGAFWLERGQQDQDGWLTVAQEKEHQR